MEVSWGDEGILEAGSLPLDGREVQRYEIGRRECCKGKRVGLTRLGAAHPIPADKAFIKAKAVKAPANTWTERRRYREPMMKHKLCLQSHRVYEIEDVLQKSSDINSCGKKANRNSGE